MRARGNTRGSSQCVDPARFRCADEVITERASARPRGRSDAAASRIVVPVQKCDVEIGDSLVIPRREESYARTPSGGRRERSTLAPSEGEWTSRRLQKHVAGKETKTSLHGS